MRIKKKYSNQYLLTNIGGIWVRNFAQKGDLLDINHLITTPDYETFIQNELQNKRLNIEHIDASKINHNACIIVSDGFDFEKKQSILAKIPREIAIIGVNGSLAKWDISLKRPMNYYVVNNPYKDCMKFLPVKHKYYPKCVASSKTFTGFLKSYRGYIYKYTATPQENFTTGNSDNHYKIDDYRNPICSALGLCYKFGVKKILLFCCDDSFDQERAGSKKMDNGLWCYPQQFISHSIIDAYCYWFSHNEGLSVKIANFSSSPKYEYVEYIDTEETLTKFLEKDDGIIHEL
jgi:hypothetical protein